MVTTYIIGAILLVPLIFVAAEWFGPHDLPDASHRLFFSILAAVLWPLLGVGLLQFGLFAGLRHIAPSHLAVPATFPPPTAGGLRIRTPAA